MNASSNHQKKKPFFFAHGERVLPHHRCLTDLIQRACQRGDSASLQTYLERQRVLDALPGIVEPGGDEGVPRPHSTPAAAAAMQDAHTAVAAPSLALHIAAALGHADQVRQLLEAGHLVHVRDYAGHTPLFVAARNGHTACVQVLRSAGAHLASDEVCLARDLIQLRHDASSAAQTPLPEIGTGNAKDEHPATVAADGPRRRAQSTWAAAGLDVPRA